LRRAVKQAHAYQLLQTTDLPAQRRLRDAQRRRGPTEVAMLGHRNEVPDQSQVEAYLLRCRISHALTTARRHPGLLRRHDT